jgi:hypothetical protein
MPSVKCPDVSTVEIVHCGRVEPSDIPFDDTSDSPDDHRIMGQSSPPA